MRRLCFQVIGLILAAYVVGALWKDETLLERLKQRLYPSRQAIKLPRARTATTHEKAAPAAGPPTCQSSAFRVAHCVSGEVRTLSHALVLESLLHNVFRAFSGGSDASYDVYIEVSAHDIRTQRVTLTASELARRTSDVVRRTLPRAPRYFNMHTDTDAHEDLSRYYDDVDGFARVVNSSVYARAFFVIQPQLLRMVYRHERCLRAIEQSGVAYDFISLLRSDVALLTPLPSACALAAERPPRVLTTDSWLRNPSDVLTIGPASMLRVIMNASDLAWYYCQYPDWIKMMMARSGAEQRLVPAEWRGANQTLDYCEPRVQRRLWSYPRAFENVSVCCQHANLPEQRRYRRNDIVGQAPEDWQQVALNNHTLHWEGPPYRNDELFREGRAYPRTLLRRLASLIIRADGRVDDNAQPVSFPQGYEIGVLYRRSQAQLIAGLHYADGCEGWLVDDAECSFRNRGLRARRVHVHMPPSVAERALMTVDCTDEELALYAEQHANGPLPHERDALCEAAAAAADADDGWRWHAAFLLTPADGKRCGDGGGTSNSSSMPINAAAHAAWPQLCVTVDARNLISSAPSLALAPCLTHAHTRRPLSTQRFHPRQLFVTQRERLGWLPEPPTAHAAQEQWRASRLRLRAADAAGVPPTVVLDNLLHLPLFIEHARVRLQLDDDGPCARLEAARDVDASAIAASACAVAPSCRRATSATPPTYLNHSAIHDVDDARLPQAARLVFDVDDCSRAHLFSIHLASI